jgi:hypothetical protein
MRHIAKFLLILSIAGCANESTKVLPQSPILPSVDFPLDGGKTLKVVYTGMPKEIAKQFMDSVFEQRNQFSEYWKAVENPENSVSVWHSCNNSSCSYGFGVFVPCDGSKSVSFTAEGMYPNIKFSYVNHDQGFYECCFIGIKKQPWWKRIFN